MLQVRDSHAQTPQPVHPPNAATNPTSSRLGCVAPPPQDAAVVLEAAARPDTADHLRALRSLDVSPCGRLLATAAHGDPRCLLHGSVAGPAAGPAPPQEGSAGAGRDMAMLRVFAGRAPV